MSTTSYSWLHPVGASAEAIDALQGAVAGLPVSYIELLRAGNGGEVCLRVNPFTLCLDSAEAALDYWKSGTYPMAGIFVFGGSGGTELLAFDLRKPEASPVIAFDSIDP